MVVIFTYWINMLKFKSAYYLYIVFLCFVSLKASSEVYQWTDEHGQTHFGDRPPGNTKPTKISDQLNQINITSELSSPEMMLRHEQWKAQQESRPSQSEKCKEAKRLLKIIQGRVVFVDENGKDLKRSEKTRAERAEKLESAIRTHCQ